MNSKALHEMLGAGTFWTALSTILPKLVSLGYFVVVLGTLTIYQYGLVELVMSLLVFMGIFGLPGLQQVVTADMSALKVTKDRALQKSLFIRFLRLRILASLIPFAFLFFGSELIALRYDEHIAGMVRVLAFMPLLWTFRAATQVLFQVFLRFKAPAVFQIASELIRLALIFLFLSILSWGPFGVIITTVLTEACSLALMVPYVRRIYRNLGDSSVPYHESLLALFHEHGKWSLVNNYFASLGYSVRVWMVKVFFGTEIVAIFAVAYGLFQQATTLFPLFQVISPLLYEARGNPDRMTTLVNRGLKYQALGAMATVIVAGIGFPLIVTLFFTQYLPSLPFFFVALIAVIPATLSPILSASFVAERAQFNLFIASGSRLALTLVSLPILLLAFGPLGVMVEVILNSVYGVADRFFRLKRFVPGFTLLPHAIFSFDDEDRAFLRRLLLPIGKMREWSKMSK